MNGIQNVIKIFAICLAVFLIVNIVGWMVFGISMFIQFLDITDEGVITDSVNIESAESETFPHIFDEQYARNLTEIDIDVKTAEINIVTNSDDILSVEIKRGEQKDFEVKANNGKLKIEEKSGWNFINSKIRYVTVRVPDYIDLKELKLEAGARENIDKWNKC